MPRFTQAEFDAYLAKERARKKPAQDDADADDGVAEGEEGKLQNQIEVECRRKGWLILRSRMDMATTRMKGEPDFFILRSGGQLLMIECKTRKSKRTNEQLGFAAWAERLGYKVHLVRSMSQFWKLIA
jgi:predicted RecB family nuclease